MGKIYLNGIGYGGVSGPANGDQVYIEPELTQGTLIADITVNDTTTSLYVPEIEANPQESATDALTKIKIDNEVYAIQGSGSGITDVTVDGASIVTDNVAILSTMTGATSLADGAKGMVPTPQIADKDKFLKGDGTWAIGGGGNSVIPNPTGSATATLEKIQIDNTIYEIDNGGGTSNVTYFFKNGNWLNTSILQFANSGGTIADGKLNLSGASCGVCVSNLGTIASIRPGAYIIGFKITDIGGTQITPQFGLCQPTDNEAAIIQTGANRISYKNTTYTAGVDYIVKIATSNNTQGVYFGAGYNTPSTQYAISEIWLEENINYDNYP